MSIHTAAAAAAAATKTVETEGAKWDSAGAGAGAGVKLNWVSEETVDACHWKFADETVSSLSLWSRIKKKVLIYCLSNICTF